MKYRCQCGKPEEIFDNKQGHPDYPLWITNEMLGHVFHFRKADRFCERCGAPLCEKCAITFMTHIGDGTTNRYLKHSDFTKHHLCHTCAELESER